MNVRAIGLPSAPGSGNLVLDCGLGCPPAGILYVAARSVPHLVAP
jgi:hypothetical protein